MNQTRLDSLKALGEKAKTASPSDLVSRRRGTLGFLVSVCAALPEALAEVERCHRVMQEAVDNCPTCRSEKGTRKCARCLTFLGIIEGKSSREEGGSDAKP